MINLFGWISQLLHGRPLLTLVQAERLKRWHALPTVDLRSPISAMRFVVVDVETSGLNLRQDRLISIGAVAVINGVIQIGDSYSIVLQQIAASNKNNILLHEIGGTEQRTGTPAVDALLGFLEYAGKDPMIAFHVAFDKTMIRRAIREYLGFEFRHHWLDLAYVMPGLNPELAFKFRTLDDWCGHFGIENDARHNALSDAFVTAQLFLRAINQAAHRKISSGEGLIYLEKLQHELQRG